MDALKESSLRPEIALQPFLPPESRLSMEPCRLDQPVENKRAGAPVDANLFFRRLFILVGTAILTSAGGYEMYEVVKVGGVTVLEGMLLAFFLALLAWVAFSFMSAVVGFFVLLIWRNGGLAIETNGPLPNLSSRTAMLLPTYNEDPHDLMARLRAMYESVGVTGHGGRFDWFLLSDTTDPDTWVREEMAFMALRRVCGADHLYYRHRYNNTARKSGNIAEWVRRFGAAYDHMIVLDADSLMEGDTIVRLVHAMEMHPGAALIQTQPVIVNASSLFSRLQQFAGRVYGPLIATGNAWWHGPESNYWGHNAIIRVRAFAESAALPELRGRRPFGGHILSHDFVEAALMRRAGWAVYMAPELRGSFEEVPPSMLDFAARDRRWCQGNLQHIAVLPVRGFHWVSRLHLLTGIGAYITAPMWLVFLILGLLISLQANFIRPEYFPKGFSLFPTWPQQDPVLAAWVFGATMGLLILPKMLAYLVLISRGDQRDSFRSPVRVFCAILCETVLAALIAPSMMILQSAAVAEILLGRDAGWQVQRRSGGEIARHEIFRKLVIPTLWGLVIGLSAYAVSAPLLFWMSPVIAGLLLAIPLGLLTSRRSSPAGLFSTPEDHRPPPVVHRANEFATSARTEATGALQQLREDAGLQKYHLASIPHETQSKLGRIDVPLATARAKIEQSEMFDDVVTWLEKPEIRAVLNHAPTLRRVLALP